MLARHLGGVLGELLRDEPVVILTGARTVGKSTLPAACADLHGVSVLDLDDLETRRAVQTDPSLFVAADRPTPVCIDEFQHVPLLLDAITSELNRDLRPGRYLLTGSTRYSALPTASQSLTGRAHVVTMWPLSQGELAGQLETALNALLTDPAELMTGAPSSTSRADYERIVLAGSFPLALAHEPGRSRDRWFRDFVSLVVDRDVLEIRKIRQRQALPQMLHRLAGQTGHRVRERFGGRRRSEGGRHRRRSGLRRNAPPARQTRRLVRRRRRRQPRTTFIHLRGATPCPTVRPALGLRNRRSATVIICRTPRRCHPRVSWSWSRAPLIAVDAVAVASPCWTRFASCWRMFLIWSFIWWLKSFEL
jgi:AAA domain